MENNLNKELLDLKEYIKSLQGRPIPIGKGLFEQLDKPGTFGKTFKIKMDKSMWAPSLEEVWEKYIKDKNN